MMKMDHGSKQPFLPHEEFSPGFDDFCNLTSRFGVFDLDLMASKCNKKAPKYFSKCFEVDSAGIDVFQQQLNSVSNYYILPSPWLALQILLHLQKWRAQALVLLPLWSSSVWFSRIFPASHLPVFVQDFIVFRPFFVQDNRAIAGMFKGRVNFDYIAMRVDFRKREDSEAVWEPRLEAEFCLKGGCTTCSPFNF